MMQHTFVATGDHGPSALVGRASQTRRIAWNSAMHHALRCLIARGACSMWAQATQRFVVSAVGCITMICTPMKKCTVVLVLVLLRPLLQSAQTSRLLALIGIVGMMQMVVNILVPGTVT